MTVEETRGRRLTILIAWLAAAPPVLVLLLMALAGRHVSLGSWIMNGAANVVFSWLLVKGRPWVRMLTVLGFALGGASSILRAVFVSGPILVRVVAFVLGAIQASGALVLSRSDSVRAYFRAENAPVALKLTGV